MSQKHGRVTLRLRVRSAMVVLVCASAIFLVCSSKAAQAQAICVDAQGRPARPVAYLVSFAGDVWIGEHRPRSDMPDRPICVDDVVVVGQASRALLHLIDANTPVRLDQDTICQFLLPPEPGSGLLDLARGALYFLSQVRRTLTVRTPYVSAAVEGTEVYLRVAQARTDMIVLEGEVIATPGPASAVHFPATTVATGERLAAAAGALPKVTALPEDGTPFSACCAGCPWVSFPGRCFTRN